jgi:hypothetical protein
MKHYQEIMESCDQNMDICVGSAFLGRRENVSRDKGFDHPPT